MNKIDELIDILEAGKRLVVYPENDKEAELEFILNDALEITEEIKEDG